MAKQRLLVVLNKICRSAFKLQIEDSKVVCKTQ